MSRTTHGRIFTRGKYNRYYLQYYLNGREIRIALKDLQGNPVSTMKEAEKARDRILKTVSEIDELERWRNVADKIATTEQRIEESKKNAEESHTTLINQKATIEDGFNLLLDCEHRPRSLRKLHRGDSIPRDTTIYNNHAYYRHFVEFLEKKGVSLLSDVTHELAFQFIEELKQTLSVNTVNKHLDFLSGMYRALINDHMIVCQNPFEGIEKDVQDDSFSRRPLPYEKIQELFSKSDGELRILLMIGYYTGLRRGDCCTLKWENVSLERGVIEKSPNKTRKRIRDKSQSIVKVGITSELRAVLESLKRDNEYVLPKMAYLYDPSRRPQLTRMITHLFHVCGINTLEEIDGKMRSVYGFHSLRYSYVSRHSEIGTPQTVIQKNVGHSNPAMTEHYERISDDAAVKYADAFSSSESPRRRLHELVDRMSDEEVNRLLDTLIKKEEEGSTLPPQEK